MKARGLRLPLPRRADPVLTLDELRMLDRLLEAHLDWAAGKRNAGRVSEAILRGEIEAESARSKIRQVLGEASRTGGDGDE